MNFEDAARQLAGLLAEAIANSADEGRIATALQTAGAVHAEALLASLAAFNQASRLAQAAEAQPARLTPAGATLQPMPEATASLRLDFPLSAEQLEQLKPAHIPNDGWERWYVEFDAAGPDGMSRLRYYRNASGYLFFDAAVEPAGDGFLVGDVTANQDDKQYTETNLAVCAAQLKILLANDLGLDDEPYWDEMDAAGD